MKQHIRKLTTLCGKILISPAFSALENIFATREAALVLRKLNTRWGRTLLSLGCFTLTNSVVTQEVARIWPDHPVLGPPLWMGFYAPWKWMSWLPQLWARCPATDFLSQLLFLLSIVGLPVWIISFNVSILRATRALLDSLTGECGHSPATINT